MRDVSLRVTSVSIPTGTEASPESACFTGTTGSKNGPHFASARGRSDLIKTSDHIRPTFYHRYDLSFTAGKVDPTIFLTTGPWACFRSNQTPKLQHYFVNHKVTGQGGRMGVNTANALTAASCTATFRPTVGNANINSAKSAAISNAANDVVDLGEDIAQAKQTTSLLSNSVAKMAKALAQAKRRNWKGMRKTLGVDLRRNPKNLPNKYLEYQFGWKPLVSNIIALVGDAGAAFGRQGVITVKGYSEDTITTYENFKTRRFVEVGLIYKINSQTADGLSSYGLTNPLNTAWQTLRYSFLIDWLIPVGDYLKGIEGVRGADFVSGYQTSVCKGGGNLTIKRFGLSSDKCSGRTFAMRRIVLNSTTLRPGATLNPKFSAKKGITALSLLAQRQ